ncbi:MAG: hypothetical protein WD065_06785, partial [Planctomycetaceae bacterium]
MLNQFQTTTRSDGFRLPCQMILSTPKPISKITNIIPVALKKIAAGKIVSTENAFTPRRRPFRPRHRVRKPASG